MTVETLRGIDHVKLTAQQQDKSERKRMASMCDEHNHCTWCDATTTTASSAEGPHWYGGAACAM